MPATPKSAAAERDSIARTMCFHANRVSVDLLAIEAGASAIGDDDVSIMESIIDVRQAKVWV